MTTVFPREPFTACDHVTGSPSVDFDDATLIEIRRCHPQDIDDAQAVAYLAMAGGKSPRNAVRAFRKKQGQYHERTRTRDLSNHDGTDHPQRSVRIRSMVRDTDAR